MSMFLPRPAIPARSGWRSKKGATTRRAGNAVVIGRRRPKRRRQVVKLHQ
jgi:hypothetical protein